MGTQEKLFSWPWEGQELQQNLGHTETESRIVRSFGILGGSRNVGLSRAWIMTLMFHRFHDSSLLHGMFSSSYRQISSTSVFYIVLIS